MATTNLLQWNPTAANQENDAAYAADSQRAGGAANPSLFDAELANKLFYQATTYLTALFSAFAAKGFTTSDSNLSTLTAQCNNFVTTADLLPPVQVLAYAATLTLNAASANGFYVQAMTGNLAIAGVTGLTSGQLVAMYYQQDATGGRTVAFPAIMVGAAQPDPAASAVSLQLFGYDATTGKLRAFGPLVSNNGAWFAGALTTAGLATLGSLTLAAPGTPGQVLTQVGGLFVPRDNAGRVDTSNGSYIQFPDGTLIQWGKVSLSGGGNQAVAITFPTAFTLISSVAVHVTPLNAAGNIVANVLGPINTTGVEAYIAGVVYVGGSGTGPSGSEEIMWSAYGR